MNHYHNLKEKQRRAECSTCYGSGQCDDAGPGDIGFNEWTCKDCGGTGWSNDVDKDIILLYTSLLSDIMRHNDPAGINSRLVYK